MESPYLDVKEFVNNNPGCTQESFRIAVIKSIEPVGYLVEASLRGFSESFDKSAAEQAQICEATINELNNLYRLTDQFGLSLMEDSRVFIYCDIQEPIKILRQILDLIHKTVELVEESKQDLNRRIELDEIMRSVQDLMKANKS